jgi:hypothetical protein
MFRSCQNMGYNKNKRFSIPNLLCKGKIGDDERY